MAARPRLDTTTVPSDREDLASAAADRSGTGAAGCGTLGRIGLRDGEHHCMHGVVGRRVVVIGAGGFAREVRWLLADLARAGAEPFTFAGYVVSSLDALGERDSREEVVGDLGWLLDHRRKVDALAIGVGSPSARLALARELEPAFSEDAWPALVHPTVVADPASCSFGPGAIVCAGTIATVNVRVGAHSVVNLGCTLGHEATVGRGCVLNPSVNISGGVSLDDGVLVGTGAQVLQYVEVGARATIGAGAVVTQDVSPETTVVGVPAKPRARRG